MCLIFSERAINGAYVIQLRILLSADMHLTVANVCIVLFGQLGLLSQLFISRLKLL